MLNIDYEQLIKNYLVEERNIANQQISASRSACLPVIKNYEDMVKFNKAFDEIFSQRQLLENF